MTDLFSKAIYVAITASVSGTLISEISEFNDQVNDDLATFNKSTQARNTLYQDVLYHGQKPSTKTIAAESQHDDIVYDSCNTAE